MTQRTRIRTARPLNARALLLLVSAGSCGALAALLLRLM